MTVFFRAYQLSELVALARLSADKACLRLRVITIDKDQIVVFMRRSKTDQEVKGVSSAVRRITDWRHCAVHRVRWFLAL